MNENPVYDTPEDIFLSNTAPDSARPKHTSGKKVSGRVCAVTIVSLSAILVLALVGVSAIVVFRPTVSESRTEASVSSDEVAMIQEDMKNLRQLVDEQAAKHATNISMLKDQHSKVRNATNSH